MRQSFWLAHKRPVGKHLHAKEGKHTQVTNSEWGEGASVEDRPSRIVERPKSALTSNVFSCNPRNKLVYPSSGRRKRIVKEKILVIFIILESLEEGRAKYCLESDCECFRFAGGI